MQPWTVPGRTDPATREAAQTIYYSSALDAALTAEVVALAHGKARSR
jgi:hypothetical protein